MSSVQMWPNHGVSLLICFKDGTEITQAMQRRQAA